MSSEPEAEAEMVTPEQGLEDDAPRDDTRASFPFKAAVRDLPPAYFALVMATGILSIALASLGMERAGDVLFAITAVAYAILAALSTLRVLWFRRRLFDDLFDHLRGPGFFTSVAASCIFGVQCLLIGRSLAAAIAFGVLGLALWVGLTYAIFTGLTVKREKPTLDQGISGAWLLAVVATQSLAVLAALIAAHWQQPYRLELNFFALSMWLWGGMLYIWTISLIFYRYTFFVFSPSDLSPPYWINMGAMAISVLAGARLIENVPDAPFLLSLLPFLKGFTVFYWATGTWWIPMLLLLGAWRHFYRHFPVRYDPSYWGAIFPLGMYTVCTLQMAQGLELRFLLFIPHYFVFAALGAWCLTFGGMLHEIITGLIRMTRPKPADRRSSRNAGA
ncbi:MAG: tellurite resistance/C4-dicarboxylate transporter family protein [Acetobacteraceae bacterium]